MFSSRDYSKSCNFFSPPPLKSFLGHKKFGPNFFFVDKREISRLSDWRELIVVLKYHWLLHARRWSWSGWEWQVRGNSGFWLVRALHWCRCAMSKPRQPIRGCGYTGRQKYPSRNFTCHFHKSIHKNLGLKNFVEIRSVTAEILLPCTNLVRTYVAWTNIIITVDIC